MSNIGARLFLIIVIFKRSGKMDSYSMFLPSYSIGADVYEKINDICSSYGKKIVCIGGKTAIDKA